jgi:tetratricopeptide (TPR) repeat protein
VNRRVALLLLLLLLAAGFSLATVLQPRTPNWTHRKDSDDMLKVLLGDGRKMFANHFFVKADVSFHSGYYPSIFDQAQMPRDSRHMTEDHHDNDSHAEEEHERAMNFMGPPRDWIEAFGRHFIITEHTHLANGNEREILPWLKISADLDPQRIETYTVSAYWLRRELGKPKEAEQFLREGLRNNPGNYELLFELGKIYAENYHDSDRARNIWELAIQHWHEQEDNKKQPDLLALEEMAIHLGRLEEQEGHIQKAITYLQAAAKASPFSSVLQQQIAELKHKLTNAPAAPKTAPSPAVPHSSG